MALPDPSRPAGSPELELIIRCARFAIGSADAAMLAERVGAGIDWDKLSQLASRHRMLPLVCHALSTGAQEELSPETSERIAQRYRSNLGRTRFLTASLLCLLDWLELNGIRAVPFKGPILAVTAYGDAALRQFTDLDILVHEEDVAPASDMLVSEGWRPDVQLNPEQQWMHVRCGWERPFVRVDANIILDLHWHITDPGFVHMHSESIWNRLEPVRLNNQELLTLGMEDTVLFLAVHGCWHQWQSLEWLCAFAKLSSHLNDCEWRRLLESAGQAGSKRMLLMACLLASCLLEAQLPQPVLTELRNDRKAQRLVDIIIGRFRRDETPSSFDGLQPFDLQMHLQMRERWSDRLRYASHKTFTPIAEELNIVRLPKPLYPLYHAIRPLRLGLKYGRKSAAARKS